MKTSRIIFPILFLCIYGAVIFHNIIPHFHVDATTGDIHESTALASHDHEHGHHHTHNDHHDTNDGESWIDILLDALGDVQHPDLGDDHFENFNAQSPSYHFAAIDSPVLVSIPSETASFSSIELEKTQNHVGHPKILYEQRRVCSSPLRGPPSNS